MKKLLHKRVNYVLKTMDSKILYKWLGEVQKRYGMYFQGWSNNRGNPDGKLTWPYITFKNFKYNLDIPASNENKFKIKGGNMTLQIPYKLTIKINKDNDNNVLFGVTDFMCPEIISENISGLNINSIPSIIDKLNKNVLLVSTDGNVYLNGVVLNCFSDSLIKNNGFSYKFNNLDSITIEETATRLFRVSLNNYPYIEIDNKSNLNSSFRDFIVGANLMKNASLSIIQSPHDPVYASSGSVNYIHNQLSDYSNIQYSSLDTYDFFISNISITNNLPLTFKATNAIVGISDNKKLHGIKNKNNLTLLRNFLGIVDRYVYINGNPLYYDDLIDLSSGVQLSFDEANNFYYQINGMSPTKIPIDINFKYEKYLLIARKSNLNVNVQALPLIPPPSNPLNFTEVKFQNGKNNWNIRTNTMYNSWINYTSNQNIKSLNEFSFKIENFVGNNFLIGITDDYKMNGIKSNNLNDYLSDSIFLVSISKLGYVYFNGNQQNITVPPLNIGDILTFKEEDNFLKYKANNNVFINLCSANLFTKLARYISIIINRSNTTLFISSSTAPLFPSQPGSSYSEFKFLTGDLSLFNQLDIIPSVYRLETNNQEIKVPYKLSFNISKLGIYFVLSNNKFQNVLTNYVSKNELLTNGYAFVFFSDEAKYYLNNINLSYPICDTLSDYFGSNYKFTDGSTITISELIPGKIILQVNNRTPIYVENISAFSGISRYIAFGAKSLVESTIAKVLPPSEYRGYDSDYRSMITAGGNRESEQYLNTTQYKSSDFDFRVSNMRIGKNQIIRLRVDRVQTPQTTFIGLVESFENLNGYISNGEITLSSFPTNARFYAFNTSYNEYLNKLPAQNNFVKAILGPIEANDIYELGLDAWGDILIGKNGNYKTKVTNSANLDYMYLFVFKRRNEYFDYSFVSDPYFLRYGSDYTNILLPNGKNTMLLSGSSLPISDANLRFYIGRQLFVENDFIFGISFTNIGNNSLGIGICNGSKEKSIICFDGYVHVDGVFKNQNVGFNIQFGVTYTFSYFKNTDKLFIRKDGANDVLLFSDFSNWGTMKSLIIAFDGSGDSQISIVQPVPIEPPTYVAATTNTFSTGGTSGFLPYGTITTTNISTNSIFSERPYRFSVSKSSLSQVAPNPFCLYVPLFSNEPIKFDASIQQKFTCYQGTCLFETNYYTINNSLWEKNERSQGVSIVLYSNLVASTVGFGAPRSLNDNSGNSISNSFPYSPSMLSYNSQTRYINSPLLGSTLANNHNNVISITINESGLVTYGAYVNNDFNNTIQGQVSFYHVNKVTGVKTKVTRPINGYQDIWTFTNPWNTRINASGDLNDQTSISLLIDETNQNIKISYTNTTNTISSVSYYTVCNVVCTIPLLGDLKDGMSFYDLRNKLTNAIFLKNYFLNPYYVASGNDPFYLDFQNATNNNMINGIFDEFAIPTCNANRLTTLFDGQKTYVRTPVIESLETLYAINYNDFSDSTDLFTGIRTYNYVKDTGNNVTYSLAKGFPSLLPNFVLKFGIFYGSKINSSSVTPNRFKFLIGCLDMKSFYNYPFDSLIDKNINYMDSTPVVGCLIDLWNGICKIRRWTNPPTNTIAGPCETILVTPFQNIIYDFTLINVPDLNLFGIRINDSSGVKGLILLENKNATRIGDFCNLFLASHIIPSSISENDYVDYSIIKYTP